MRYFLGNLEDPALRPVVDGGLLCFPRAFWLEPQWRDTKKFPIDWLLIEAAGRDVVMMLHADNVMASPKILRDILVAIERLEAAVLPRFRTVPTEVTTIRTV